MMANVEGKSIDMYSESETLININNRLHISVIRFLSVGWLIFQDQTDYIPIYFLRQQQQEETFLSCYQRQALLHPTSGQFLRLPT